MAGKGSKPGERRGGRGKGTPNKLTQAARDRIQRDGDPVGFLLSVMRGEAVTASPVKEGATAVTTVPTLDQRLSAAQTLARKCVPDAKDRPITFDLPPVKSPADVMKAAGAVLAAVAMGKITPSEGQTVTAILNDYRRAIETQELEKRIAALEGKDK